MIQKTTNKCILSICNISPTRRGSFEDFLISLSGNLQGENLKHVIVFREKPAKIVEEALIGNGAEIKIFKPSEISIYNIFPLYRLIKENKPEITHFHFYPVYTVINSLSLFSKTKILYTDHMGHSKKANTFFKKMSRRIYYYANSKLFDFGITNIVCVSNFVKDKYHKEYGIYSNKFSVIYNGISTKRFQRINNTGKIKEKYNIKDEFVVSCVGLTEEKGAHYLINAAPEIIKHFPKTKFILVGEGEFRSYLEKRINELDLGDYFIFSGKTDHIEEIYNISSCVVIPTLGDEAFCFVAAEAMSTETPVIAFDSGAIKEIVYNKSNVISISSKELSDKIIQCLKSDDNFVKAAREYVVRSFSMEKNIFNYIDLYQKLLR